MILSFKHAGLESFYRTGSKRGINPKHAARIARQLTALNVAQQRSDMAAPGWKLHPLKGELMRHWSLTVSGNWRITFAFEEANVTLVDYIDYH